MTGRDRGNLLLLAALWGGSFLFIRIAAPALGPLLVVTARVAIAGLVLGGYAWMRHIGLPWANYWRQFIMMGLLNAAIPYTLITIAELQITAGLAAILNATTPLFAALVAAAWLGERLTLARCAGLGLGLAGVVVLVGWTPLPAGIIGIAAIGASLLAAASYAVAGAYGKQAFSGLAPLPLAIGQQLGAVCLILPFAIPSGVRDAGNLHLTPTVALAILGLAVLSTAIAYVLYFALLSRVGPTNTLSVTFLVPGFGLLWSALFLHETVTVSTLLGLGLILLSVFLVTGVRLRPVSRATISQAQ